MFESLSRNHSRSGLHALLSAVVVACGGCAMDVSQPAAPEVGVQSAALQEWIRDRVYVMSSDATTSHAPTGSLTYNSQGGDNYIERTGVGRYTVHAQWINDAGGNVQVVAYGDDASRCKVSGWTTNSTRYAGSLAAGVRCHGANGAAVDSRFALHFLGPPWGSDAGDAAYLWTATTATHTVDTPYAFNGGGRIEFERSSAGTYYAKFFGLTLDSRYGNVQVAAYGTGPEYCTVTLTNCSTSPACRTTSST